jgi:hypothetical protein
MRFPIDFDNQLALMAGEIGEERSDRMLSAKLVAGETATAEFAPENSFGGSQGSPKFTGSVSTA